MSALAPPSPTWWKPLGRDERAWVTLGLIWCVVLFAMMWVWPYIGRQNTPTESYRVDPALFRERAERFIAAYQTGTEGGTPVVTPPPGTDVYVVAQTFQFRPILKLRKGETYRLLITSLDMQHGLSIQPAGLNFQILPGYLTVLRLTPTEAGQFQIVCNEYCGLGHHLMSGKIVVTE